METITIGKRHALGLLAGFALLFVLGIGGTVAWASNRFSDVPDDHIFHDNIDWVAGAGIVNGFADGTYKPGNNVTRGQLAAFIHRASGNAPGIAPSFNAASLGGKTAAVWQEDIDTQYETQQAEIDALKNKLAAVTYNAGAKVLTISGANLQIVSGSGSTSGPINGLGNLIVGYNENISDIRTGSHNLVVGQRHSYSSYGGLVAGWNNTISGFHSTVTGGEQNTASGSFASISGGNSNTANGTHSSVGGGYVNTAGGMRSTVSGGAGRNASGDLDWWGGGLFQDF